MTYTRLTRAMRHLLINLLLFPVLFSFAIEGAPDGGDQGGADGGDGGAGGDGGNGDQGGAGNAEDLATLFTPEEIQGKKDAIEQGKAEEARRAALSDDERAAEDQAKEKEAKASEGAPEEYEDFKIPEGLEAAKELLDEFKPFLKSELNLNQVKAQALVDFYTTKILPGMQARGLQASTESWNQDLAERSNAIKADAEVGGEKYEKTVAEVNRVANTFLSPEESTEMMEFFKRFGDCKPFLKLLVRQGAAMKEGGIVMSGAGGESQKKSLESRIYGDENS